MRCLPPLSNKRHSTGAHLNVKVHSNESAEFDAAELVMRIRFGQESGLTDLYRLFVESLSRCFSRSLGFQDVEDKVHDAFLVVVRSIRHGELRDPERLLAFIHGIIRRQVATVILQLVRKRRREADIGMLDRVAAPVFDPEQRVASEERGQLMSEVLLALDPREREILTRFYLEEQTPVQICGAMRLSETQFRLLKSRAKSRFGELGKKKTQTRPWPLLVPAAQPLVHDGIRI